MANETYYLPLYQEALMWGEAQSGYRYIGNGGLKERWSFKLNIREDDQGLPTMPPRCVYIVAADGMHQRNLLALRDTLRTEENADLKAEYGKLKTELSKRTDFTDIWQYAEAKDKVVRRILIRAGWTDAEIAEKEAMREQHWPDHFTI